MQSISFHKANTEDVSILVENRMLFALEISGEQKKEDIDKLKQQTTNYFLKATADNSCISFIAKSGEFIAGIGSIVLREQAGNFKNPSGKWGYVMNMYTKPEFRRRGICKTILNLLLSEAQKLGVTAFELHATKQGEHVYTKEGFLLHSEPTLRKWH